jgi:hypothetical protein
MNILFPRTIVLKRPTQGAGVSLGHIGVSTSEEVVIWSGVCANIAFISSGRNTGSTRDVPADSPGPIKWAITISAADAAALPIAVERDMVYDDSGRRFQVSAYEAMAAGGTIDCVRIMV